jgi:hypothetical protein
MQSKRKSKGSRQPRNRNEQWNPPQLQSNIIVKHRYRFRSTSATATSISDTNLIQVGGLMVTAANTTARAIMNTVKIHSVEVWAPPASQGAASTCAIEWASSQFSSQKEVTDTTVSVALPAYVKAFPPKGSPPSFWLLGSNSAIFKVTAPVGSVIDVLLSHVMLDTDVAGDSYTIASGGLGIVFYPPLDGATDLFVPVSLTTKT